MDQDRAAFQRADLVAVEGADAILLAEVGGIVVGAEAPDPAGMNHDVERVAHVLVAQVIDEQHDVPPILGLLGHLIYGAVLRDVGMLRVSDSLLASAQDLSADQWETIRRHPVEGASIMRQMRFGPIAIDVVMHHHESYNGEGYPMGLRGRAIPLGARIVAVAEAFVKMTLDRPYRRALGRAEALESIAENWGLRYDPLVVDALLRVVNREMSAGLGTDSDLARDLFSV